MKIKNEKIGVLLFWLIGAWLVTIFIIFTFQIRGLKTRIMELETENTQLLEDLDEVFDEVGDDFELYRERVKQLEERIEYLENVYDKDQRPSFEDYQYGIAKVVSRLNYGDYYTYVVEIQEVLLTVYSQKLFSVGEDILIIEYSEGKIILVDLS